MGICVKRRTVITGCMLKSLRIVTKRRHQKRLKGMDNSVIAQGDTDGIQKPSLILKSIIGQ